MPQARAVPTERMAGESETPGNLKTLHAGYAAERIKPFTHSAKMPTGFHRRNSC
jgi:hypothetical protein